LENKDVTSNYHEPADNSGTSLQISTEALVGEDKSCLELVITREHQAVEIQWEAANPDFLRSKCPWDKLVNVYCTIQMITLML